VSRFPIRLYIQISKIWKNVDIELEGNPDLQNFGCGRVPFQGSRVSMEDLDI